MKIEKSIPAKAGARTSPRKGPGRPSLKGSAELDQHLIEVASSLFKAQGFGGVTMDQVAATAGVGKHSLYRRYPNREKLFRDVFSHAFHEYVTLWDRLNEVANRFIANHPDNALEGLRLYARAMFDLSTDLKNKSFVTLYFQERHRFPDLDIFVSKLIIDQDKEITRLIDLAKAQGGLTRNIVPYSATHLKALTSSYPMLNTLVDQPTFMDLEKKDEYFDSVWVMFVACHC